MSDEFQIYPWLFFVFVILKPCDTFMLMTYYMKAILSFFSVYNYEEPYEKQYLRF